MRPVSHAVASLDHEREHGRQLPVYEGLQGTGHAKVVQGKAPYGHVGPSLALKHACHVIVHAALTGRLAPAGKATLAGRNVRRAHGHGTQLDVGHGISHAIQERRCKPHGVAGVTLWAAVDEQDVHRWSPCIVSSRSLQAWLHSPSMRA